MICAGLIQRLAVLLDVSFGFILRGRIIFSEKLFFIFSGFKLGIFRKFKEIH